MILEHFEQIVKHVAAKLFSALFPVLGEPRAAHQFKQVLYNFAQTLIKRYFDGVQNHAKIHLKLSLLHVPTAATHYVFLPHAHRIHTPLISIWKHTCYCLESST